MKAKSVQGDAQNSSLPNGRQNGGKPTAKPVEQTEQFFHIKDERTHAQKNRQTAESEQIYKNNLKVLKIQMTEKTKVEYTPAKLFKVEFPNGWYAMITDNEIDSEYTVLTVHGSPGDHREWAGLETQMKGTVRWMNFVIPGFDGQDQRRGNYSGSAQDLAKLIYMVLEERKASKLIYCGHSMGSIFGGYFLNRYPDIVHGYVNVTGIVNQWYIGLMVFYRCTSAAYGFGRGPNQASMIRLLNKNQYREKHHARFIADIKDVRYSEKVTFPELMISEMCAYIKLFTSLSRGCSEFYQLNQRLRLLRVLLFGKNDPLHEIPKTDQQIYSITRGRFRFDQYPQNAKLLASMKEELEDTVWQVHSINIKAEKLQEYFCYHFDDTGHNVHKRRPKQISKILRVYITVLKVMEKYKPVIQSRL